MKPEISVVIPSYNHQAYIGLAIESVINQTFKNWELIIIDDGSTDNSVDLIKKYTDPRIRLIVQKNHDAPYTINKGIKESNGKYIAILNSDDIFEPLKLEKSVAALSEGYDFTFGRLYVMDEDNKRIGPDNGRVQWLDSQLNYSDKKDDINKLLKNANYLITTSNYVFRKEITDKIGFFHEKMHYAHDFEFATRVYANGFKVKFIPEFLASYRIHSGSTLLTSREKTYLEASYAIAKVLRNGKALSQLDVSFSLQPVISNIVLYFLTLNEQDSEKIINDKDDARRTVLLNAMGQLYDDIYKTEEIIRKKNEEISRLNNELAVTKNYLRWKIPNYMYKRYPVFFDALAKITIRLIDYAK